MSVRPFSEWLTPADVEACSRFVIDAVHVSRRASGIAKYVVYFDCRRKLELDSVQVDDLRRALGADVYRWIGTSVSVTYAPDQAPQFTVKPRGETA